MSLIYFRVAGSLHRGIQGPPSRIEVLVQHRERKVKKTTGKGISEHKHAGKERKIWDSEVPTN
ncbi:hypothetical protein PISMIDRAFT_678887, partial [Pisolithus microcarpus 441]